MTRQDDRNPGDPYHRVRELVLSGGWVCTKCGAEFASKQSAEEHEASRGGEG